MSIRNRPYVGTWQMSNQTVVRHTPDAIVYINGYTEFATCTTCNKPLNLQKYITSVSVDASIEPISTANFSLKVPRHEADVFSYDGNYVLRPNLEVVILMRGYFPMTDYAGKGQDPLDADVVDANDVPVYPYYQVFRGVVTEVSHEYSGGFYSATVQAANLLHFWQNLKVSVNGSVFGKRPNKSMVEPHLVGHRFTGANPYSIIYTLVKVGFGAAYGVDFQRSQSTNVAATDDDNRASLFAHAAEWWEQRWTEHSGNLRMYGINGQIFNSFQQAYLGRWYDTRHSGRINRNAFYLTAKRIYDKLDGGSDFNLDRAQEIMENARELGWNPYATNASIVASGGNKDKLVTEDILRMQAFTLDIGKMGSVNLFETEYMSKLEIVEMVKTVTGYEFYQDVDGDLVFKPPMYNLDTRSDPVYRISDRDLISISETESEPEATMMKGTGSVFSNVTTGIDGWLGVGGVFIDYRLVAKYGYKEETFETNYMNNRHAIFVSAMNRLDLANVGVQSASITIPVRPEMRPGYPVYVEHLDCFYYARSLSHSISFGGSCTTSITGVAKRAKFLPPMDARGDGTFPTLDNVRLDAPDEYPSQPLYGFPNRVEGDDESTGPARVYGFPNVILALDADKINLDTVDIDRSILSAEAYIQIALSKGFLERGATKDTFRLRSSNDSWEEVYLTDIQQDWNDAAQALSAGEEIQNPTSALGQILQFIDQRLGGIDTPDVQNLITYLSLQTSLKSMFSPGTTIAGKYRYYSSSHPNPNHQAPKNLLVDQENGEILGTSEGPPDEGFSQEVDGLEDLDGGKGITKKRRAVTRSVRVAAFSNAEPESDTKRAIVPAIKTQNVSTADIRFVTFGPQITRKQYRVSEIREGWTAGVNFALHPGYTRAAFASLLKVHVVNDASKTVEERFSTEYGRLLSTIDTFATLLGVSEKSPVIALRAKVKDVPTGLLNYAGIVLSDTPYTVSTETVRGIRSDVSDYTVVLTLSMELSDALWAYANTVANAARALENFEEKVDQFMVFRADWISAYTEGLARPNDSSPGKTFFFSPEYAPTPDWTPIYPVSDGGGYEVYGNLPYGRGVDVAFYADLLSTTNSGDDDGSPTDTSENSETLIGNRGGSNAASIDKIEQLFAAALVYQYGGLSDIQKAQLASQLDTTVTNLSSVVAELEKLREGDPSQAAKIRNAPVTSFFRGQSIFGDVAARNLANLDVGGSICACKGVNQEYLLLAFSEEWIDRHPEDPLQGFLDENTFASTESWKASRDAMAGRTRDTRNDSLAEQFEREGSDLVENFANLGQDVGNTFNPDEEG